MSDPEPARIGINLLWLVPGEVGGSEEYTVRLLEAVAALDVDDIELILYVNRRFSAAHPELVSRFTTRVAPVSGSSRGVRVLVESTWLALRTRIDRCRSVHHAGGTMPAVRSAPGIVTIHDLQPLANPERFGPVKGAYIRSVVPRSLRKARQVVALSEFVAADVVARVGIARDRVALVPCGIDDPGAAVDMARSAELLQRLGLHDHRFVIYPAITYPHKNHATLVAAFARLTADDVDVRLVLTGGAGPSEEVLTSTIAAYGLESKVIRTGRIPEKDLDLLYRHATMLAFPSQYEGFGVPVLEAMARGCPVVASDAASLPEVIGEAGLFVPALDVARWADAMSAVLDDGALRTALVRKGFERARLFSWPVSAEALLVLYREIR